MQILIVILSLVLLGVIGFVYLAISRKLDDLSKGQQSVPTDIHDIKERFEDTRKSVGGLLVQLGTMQGIAKDVSDLRLTFYSAKLRGNFGERVLNDMLENSFPKELFELQHRFRDGQVVDAIVKTKDGFICIDSKFPIENYRKMVIAEKANNAAELEFETREFKKAVKKHISDIASKYIVQAEGTMDIAVMYVPSEAVFHEIISSPDDELVKIAESQRVLMTSPNTMSYFLHILRLGHERSRIEENVERVWKQVSGLEQDFEKFGDNLRQLWTHVNNAKNKADSVGGDFTKLAGKVSQLKKSE